MNEKDQIIEIFSGNLWEADMVQSLLLNAEIESFQRNALGIAYGFNPSTSGEVKVMISSKNQSEASKIVEEYRINLKTENRD